MNNELKFFTIDERRKTIIDSIIKQIVPQNPAEIPSEMQKTREDLEKIKQELITRIKALPKNMGADLIELLELLRSYRRITSDEKYIKCYEYFVNLDEVKQRLLDDRIFETLLECIRDLTELGFDICTSRMWDKSAERACSIVKSIKEMFKHENNDYIEQYFTLKNKEAILTSTSRLVFEEGLEKEYSLLISLAEICEHFSWTCFFELNAGCVLDKVFNGKITENKEIHSLLEYVRYLTEIGEVDLVKAYSYLVELNKRLTITMDVKACEHLFKSGLVPALAYVLAHTINRVNLENLVMELSEYVKLVLTAPGSYADKVSTLYLNLLKILSMLLCADGIDWKTVLALGITASRYWRKWSDVSSINALCSGLKTLSQYVSKEEAEKIITYAAIFGDYDIIIKLEPLVRTRRSLGPVASLLS